MNDDPHIEIELRFLARGTAWRRSKYVMIEQRYISMHPEHAVRIRISGSNAALTIKGRRKNDANPEYEWPLEMKKARAMFANENLFEGFPIIKTGIQ